jgi:hypothetical protein
MAWPAACWKARADTMKRDFMAAASLRGDTGTQVQAIMGPYIMAASHVDILLIPSSLSLDI